MLKNAAEFLALSSESEIEESDNRSTAPNGIASQKQTIHSGYIHVRREDNKSFTEGRWSVSVETETIMKTPITYVGAVTISALTGRPSSPLADPLYGPVIGKRATLR